MIREENSNEKNNSQSDSTHVTWNSLKEVAIPKALSPEELVRAVNSSYDNVLAEKDFVHIEINNKEKYQYKFGKADSGCNVVKMYLDQQNIGLERIIDSEKLRIKIKTLFQEEVNLEQDEKDKINILVNAFGEKHREVLKKYFNPEVLQLNCPTETAADGSPLKNLSVGQASKCSVLTVDHPQVLLCLYFGIDPNIALTREINFNIKEFSNGIGKQLLEDNYKAWTKKFSKKKKTSRVRSIKDDKLHFERIRKRIPKSINESDKKILDTYADLRYRRQVLISCLLAINYIENDNFEVKMSVHTFYYNYLDFLQELDAETIIDILLSCAAPSYKYVIYTFKYNCSVAQVLSIIKNLIYQEDFFLVAIWRDGLIIAYKKDEDKKKVINSFTKKIEEITGAEDLGKQAGLFA